MRILCFIQVLCFGAQMLVIGSCIERGLFDVGFFYSIIMGIFSLVMSEVFRND